MRRSPWPSALRVTLVSLVIVAVSLSSPAAADPGGPFRRTTPRGSLDQDAGGLVVGIPAGRAWGAEGSLRPVDPSAAHLTVDLAVDDPDVAEAFVRVAFYARGDARSRQLATVDSPFVRIGPERTISIELRPPPGAVAYRIRVLGRLAPGAVISRADAIRARWATAAAERGSRRPSLTRLLTDVP